MSKNGPSIHGLDLWSAQAAAQAPDGMSVAQGYSPEPWYALRVTTRYENSIDRQLRRLGYETLLPTYTVRRKWSDRVKSLQRPLFPGYVLCRLNLNHAVPAYTLPHVLGVVRCGSECAAIPNEQIELIRRVIEFGVGLEPWADLAPGTEVEIAQGPLAGCRGKLVEARGRFRLVVAVDPIERAFCVEVGQRDIRPIRIPNEARTRELQSAANE